MENKKYNYTIRWVQPYDNWPSMEWLDEVESALLEFLVESSDLSEAQEVLRKFAKQ